MQGTRTQILPKLDTSWTAARPPCQRCGGLVSVHFDSPAARIRGLCTRCYQRRG